MGNFKQGGGGGFNKRSGGKSGFFKKGSRGGSSGGRDHGPITLHEAICDQCGSPCEIPFRPTPGKLVYCNTCFKDKKEGGNGGGFSPRSTPRYESPTRIVPENSMQRENNDAIKKQLELLNTKMDQLIQILKSATDSKPTITKEIKKASPVSVAKKPVKKVSKK